VNTARTDQRRVLYVEDDPNDVVLLRRAFKRAELMNELIHVGDGEKAIAYLQGRGEYADRDRFPIPSLLIIDLKRVFP
jgi:CheY-like chemotaxis protein